MTIVLFFCLFPSPLISYLLFFSVVFVIPWPLFFFSLSPTLSLPPLSLCSLPSLLLSLLFLSILLFSIYVSLLTYEFFLSFTLFTIHCSLSLPRHFFMHSISLLDLHASDELRNSSALHLGKNLNMHDCVKEILFRTHPFSRPGNK